MFKLFKWTKRAGLVVLIALAIILPSSYAPSQVLAATAPSLGTAQSFAVLGGSTVTNTGPTVVNGDLGVWPGSAVTGFPPGIVVPPGTRHAGDAVARQAQIDVTTAYNDLAGQAVTADLTGQDLGGMTLTPGVYHFLTSAQLTGVLTLDAQGNPDSVFIFQIGSTLTTASDSSVVVINGPCCNKFWQVGTSATLGTRTAFQGNILALASITLNTDASLLGRALARNGAVTMDNNTVSIPVCTGPTATSITVTSPNGGGSWQAGTTQTISWTYTGNPGDSVKIELLKGGVVISLIAPTHTPIGTGGSGSYEWDISSLLRPQSDYAVRITSSLAYVDTSDNNFTITSVQTIWPSTTVTIVSNPVGPVVAGSTVTLTVTEHNTGNADLTSVNVVVNNGSSNIATLVAPPDSSNQDLDSTLNASGGGETWTWQINSGPLTTNTTFTATGDALDPLGNHVTYPPLTSEQATVNVTLRELPPSIPTIPTMGQWGMIAMATLLAGSLVWVVRKRQTSSGSPKAK